VKANCRLCAWGESVEWPRRCLPSLKLKSDCMSLRNLQGMWAVELSSHSGLGGRFLEDKVSIDLGFLYTGYYSIAQRGTSEELEFSLRRSGTSAQVSWFSHNPCDWSPSLTQLLLPIRESSPSVPILPPSLHQR